MIECACTILMVSPRCNEMLMQLDHLAFKRNHLNAVKRI